jgi:putative ABC transport system permease protein
MTLAVTIAVLITALFLKMLLSKDMSQIAIMRSVGLTSDNIKHQYMAGTLMVLIAGILLGVLASDTLGEFVVSMAMSFMGASRIQFVDAAWLTWLLCPLALIAVVGSTVSVCCKVTLKHDLSVVLRS